MNPPKMPVHIGDLLRDTSHLGTDEFGAYMLLLFHHWSTGNLPDDDKRLATITRMTAVAWKRARPELEKFFDAGWRHGRVEKDLEAARASYQKRAKAGEKGGKAKAETKQCSSNATPTDEALLKQPYTLDLRPDTDSEANASAADAARTLDLDVVDEDPKARLFRLGKTILVSFGIAEKRTGALLGQWLKAQPDPAGLLAAIQFSRDQNVADPVAYVSALVHAKPKNGAKNAIDRQPGESVQDHCNRLAADARELERAAGVGRPDAAFRGH